SGIVASSRRNGRFGASLTGSPARDPTLAPRPVGLAELALEDLARSRLGERLAPDVAGLGPLVARDELPAGGGQRTARQRRAWAASPHVGCGMPKTAASSTAGCA